MSDLNVLLHSKLDNVLTDFLKNHHNESGASSSKAVQLVVPTIVAGLLNYVSKQPSHFSELSNLISGNNGEQFNELLNNVQTNSNINQLEQIIGLGKGLLPTLLGSQTHVDNTAAALATESSISNDSASSLLALTLPLVLAVLRGHGEHAQLSGVLTNAETKTWLETVLPAGLLRALGIGSISGLAATALAGLGSSGTVGSTTTHTSNTSTYQATTPVATSSGGGIGKWIALALAALLAIWGIKSCTSKDEVKPVAHQTNTEPALANAAMAASAAANMATAAANSAQHAANHAASAVTSAAANVVNAARVLADDASEAFYEDGIVKIYFAVGSSEIAKNAQTVSKQVVDDGKAGKKLVISGFTDSTGSDALNAKLAKDRAEAVKAFLLKEGVSEANIELRKPDDTIGAVGNNIEGRRVDIRVQ